MKQADLDLLRRYAGGQPILGANGTPLNTGAARASAASANARLNAATKLGQQRIDAQQAKANAQASNANARVIGAQTRQARQQAQAQAQQQALARRQQAFQARQQASADAQAQAQRNANIRTGVALSKASTNAVGHPIRSFVQSISSRAGSVPTPGGITPLIVLLLTLTFAIVPASDGRTRLQLLWLTFLGQTRLPDTTTPDSVTSEIIDAGRSARGPVGGTTSDAKFQSDISPVAPYSAGYP